MPRNYKTLGFDSYDNVIRAALDGQGVALGFSNLITKFVAEDRLVRPMRAALSSGKGVYLVTPSGTKPAAKVQRFIDWVCEEAEADAT